MLIILINSYAIRPKKRTQKEIDHIISLMLELEKLDSEMFGEIEQ